MANFSEEATREHRENLLARLNTTEHGVGFGSIVDLTTEDHS